MNRIEEVGSSLVCNHLKRLLSKTNVPRARTDCNTLLFFICPPFHLVDTEMVQGLARSKADPNLGPLRFARRSPMTARCIDPTLHSPHQP